MRTVLLPVFLFFLLNTAAQGRYAGPVMKNLINKSYTDSRKLSQLAGYQSTAVNLISAVNDPKQIYAEILKKGTTAVVLFSELKDTVKMKYVILDVIEIKNVIRGWEVRTTLCRKEKVNYSEIVAVAKKSKEDYLTEIRQAWRFNYIKQQFESMPVNDIDCFNERGD